MHGLSKRLRNGHVEINTVDKCVEIKASTGSILDKIFYSELKPSDWGTIYEKHVAQWLFKEGYDVELRGLNKGFLDNGIDIIATKENQQVYAQCKYTFDGKLSKNHIEWILYKASKILRDNYCGKKLEFWLVVPSKQQAFSMKKSGDRKILYPNAEYFMSKNTTVRNNP